MTWYPNQVNRVSGIDQLTVVYDEFLYIYSFQLTIMRIATRPDQSINQYKPLKLGRKETSLCKLADTGMFSSVS